MDRIAHLMKTLDLTREEALQVIAEDERIDKMGMSEVNNDLNPEQKKTVKKMKQADRKVTAYKFEKKERKANNAKRTLVEILSNAVTENGGENLDISNIEREFTFMFESVKYKVVLSAPRK